ncbi:MAG: hypothetical protein HYZ68_01000, partial [Chloroflexi bacterium]|nr:hypothetical protein [Chloroflexota bacterium]
MSDDRRLLVNGAIYTMDAARPLVEGIAIQGSRIAAVGSDPEMRELAAAGDEIID